MNELPQWISQLGFPTAILLGIIIAGWRFVKWLLPRIERLIDAHVKRQEEVTSAMKNLADETVKIQKANSDNLEKLVDRVFQHKRKQK